jgi:hypothetical protein
MSNPTTNYIDVNNNDLGLVFQPILLGTVYPYPTLMFISDGKDLNEIFANISSGFSIDYNVGYSIQTSSGIKDLSKIFAKKKIFQLFLF